MKEGEEGDMSPASCAGLLNGRQTTETIERKAGDVKEEDKNGELGSLHSQLQIISGHVPIGASLPKTFAGLLVLSTTSTTSETSDHDQSCLPPPPSPA